MSKAVERISNEKPGTVIAESKEGIEVSTGEGILSFSRLQLPSKKAMDTADFLNGRSMLGAQFT